MIKNTVGKFKTFGNTMVTVTFYKGEDISKEQAAGLKNVDSLEKFLYIFLHGYKVKFDRIRACSTHTSAVINVFKSLADKPIEEVLNHPIVKQMPINVDINLASPYGVELTINADPLHKDYEMSLANARFTQIKTSHILGSAEPDGYPVFISAEVLPFLTSTDFKVIPNLAIDIQRIGNSKVNCSGISAYIPVEVFDKFVKRRTVALERLSGVKQLSLLDAHLPGSTIPLLMRARLTLFAKNKFELHVEHRKGKDHPKVITLK